MLKVSRLDAPPNTELFLGMDQPEIESVLAAARPLHFRASSVMTRQGESADRLFLLWRGRARYFFETADGKKLNLVWITPGHIFGAGALANPPETYLVSTEAVRDSIVFVWDGPTIRGLAQRFPQLMMNAYLTSMNYLSWYVGAYAALASQSARERLAHILLGYAPSIGQKVSDGVELSVTNQELAEAANITPVTISRLISEWQKSGAVRKRRGKLVLTTNFPV